MEGKLVEVKCRSCNTVFGKISDSKIPDDGLRRKCPRCQSLIEIKKHLAIEEHKTKEKIETVVDDHPKGKPAPDDSKIAITNKNRILKEVAVRALFLFLAVTAFLGLADKFCNKAMKHVWKGNEAFLEKSMVNASGGIMVLIGIDSALSVAESIEAEPSAAGFKVGSVGIGQIISPIKDVVGDLRDYMILSVILVMSQIAIIKLINAISLKVLFGIGSGLCVVQYKRNSIWGKIGASFIILAVLLYFVYPLAFKIGTDAYKAHQIENSVKLSEDLGILKEQVVDLVDIDLSLVKLVDNVRMMPTVVGQSMKTVWDGTIGLFVGLLIMFVFVPMLSLGVIYLIGRQALTYLDMSVASEKVDTGAKKIKDRVMPRTLSRLFAR